MIVGDYFHGLADLAQLMSSHYQLHNIALGETNGDKQEDLDPNWIELDFRNFHDFTIEFMEFEPDILIYLSPYIRKSRAEINPEPADISNREFIEHIREVSYIQNTHVIVLMPNLHENDELDFPVWHKTITAGIECISGSGRYTIISIPEILDSSPEGLVSWLNDQDPLTFTNLLGDLETLRVQKLAEEISEVISSPIFGSYTINGTKLSKEDLQFIKSPLHQTDSDFSHLLN